MTTQTRHIATDTLTPLIPAFALLRLYEEAGLPMRAGIVTLVSDGVENACRWIMPYAPLWAAATLIRASKKEPLRETFDRVRVGTLNPTEVETMRNWLVTAIRVAVEFLPLQQTAHGDSFSERVLEELVDLLSRLCMRLSPQQLEEVFRLALQLHKHPGVQSHVAHHDVCRPLFRRIFDAANGEQLCSWLPDLLALPTLSVSGAAKSTWGDHQWPDPFDELDAEILKQCREKFDHNEITNRRIEELLRDAQHERDEARRRAVNRLWVLSNGGLLSPKQQNSFGKVLWAQVSEETGLPSATRFYAHAFLNLPAPNRIAATNAVRHRLLTAPTLRWFSETVQPNGHTSWQLKHYGRKNPIITDVLAATRPLGAVSVERNLISWTSDETSLLLKKAVDWWDADKNGLKHGTDAAELRRAIEDIVPFFQTVVLARLHREAVDEWKTIDRVLKELEENNIDVMGCLPAFLIAWPERADEIAARIRAALQRGDEKGVAGAAEAIRCWSLLTTTQKGRKIPIDLTDELCHRVADRQQPALDTVIIKTARMLRETPKVFSTKQIFALCRGLEYLLEETRLLTRDERACTPSSSARVPVEQRPRYRMLGAWLAFELYKNFQNRNSSLPLVLEQWKQICESDPLPEVRRQWRA